MHAIIVDCLMPLVNCSRAIQDHAAAIRHLQQLLAALELIIGCHSVEVFLLPESPPSWDALSNQEPLQPLAAAEVVGDHHRVTVCCVPAALKGLLRL